MLPYIMFRFIWIYVPNATRKLPEFFRRIDPSVKMSRLVGLVKNWNDVFDSKIDRKLEEILIQKEKRRQRRWERNKSHQSIKNFFPKKNYIHQQQNHHKTKVTDLVLRFNLQWKGSTRVDRELIKHIEENKKYLRYVVAVIIFPSGN